MVALYAEWQVGQLAWSMLWLALFFMLAWLMVTVFMDVFRDPELGGLAKALWTLFIVLAPWLGIFVYLLARGGTMADRRYLASYTDYGKLRYGPGPPGAGGWGAVDDAPLPPLQPRSTAR